LPLQQYVACGAAEHNCGSCVGSAWVLRYASKYPRSRGRASGPATNWAVLQKTPLQTTTLTNLRIWGSGVRISSGAPVRRQVRTPVSVDFTLDPDTRGRSIFGGIADVATWLHTLMQYANDLDQARPDRAGVNNVGRPFHCWRQVASTGMADVKTANPVQYLVAIPRRATVRITRHLAHGHCDQRGIPAPALGSPPLAAGGKNTCKVCSCQS
jgi:hypothetical protein